MSITKLERGYALEGEEGVSEEVELLEDVDETQDTGETVDEVGDVVMLDDTAVDTPMVIANDPGISMTIAGNLSQQTQAEPGKLAYRSHNVKISGTNIEQYSLRISYDQGSSALAYDGSGGTTIAGADGKTGTSNDNNWWGYSWHNNGVSETTLAYQTMPAYGSGTALESASPADNTVAIDKTLTFAAKFADNATPGHYKANVLLSLLATPKAALKTWAELEKMQEMTPEICTNNTTKAVTGNATTGVKTVVDERDGTSYKIAKLADNNCWMLENLKIINKKLTSDDSDVKSDFTLPATKTKAGFTSTNKNTIQVYTGSDAIPSGTVYYNWYTATAGTGTDSVTNSAEAPSSICPKGWRLPSGGPSGQFQGLATAIGATSSTWRGQPYDFAATGIASSGGLDDPTDSYYWSRTAESNTYASSAFVLSIYGSAVSSLSASGRYYGSSVRCVAKKSGE